MTPSPQATDAQHPVVVIVGGGFAGLEVARGLRRAPLRVLLIDRQNHHLFQPLLYQVATAALSPADIATPIRSIVRRQANVEVILSQVDSVDLERRQIAVGRAVLSYDHLVLAAGATHSYFGHDAWAEDAPGLKTIDDAVEIRRRMLLAFEAAEVEGDEAARRAKLTFVVVGGGPTGVELAGAIKEIAAKSIPRDFRHIDTTTTRVILVEGAARLLGQMPPELSDRALADLRAIGVDVMLGALVTDVEDGAVWLGDERIAAENVFWAAGVEAPPLARTLGVPLDDRGRIRVGSDLALPGHPDVFAIGDLAHVEDVRTGQLVPGVAPAAIQMGRYVARLLRTEADRIGPRSARRPFAYRDKGSMATIGRARAVAAIGSWTFTGFFAWLLWGFVHVVPLATFRNRLFVMLSWVWSYVLFSKGARLITGKPEMRVRRPRDG